MRKINRQKRGASNKPQATLQARKLRPRARFRQQLQLRRNNHSPAANPALKRHLLLNLHLLGRVRSSEEKGDVRPLSRPLPVRRNQEVTRLRRSNLLQTTRINFRASVPKNN